MKKLRRFFVLALTVVFVLTLFPVMASASGWADLFYWGAMLGSDQGNTNSGQYDNDELANYLSSYLDDYGASGEDGASDFGSPVDAGDTVPSYYGEDNADNDYEADPPTDADGADETYGDNNDKDIEDEDGQGDLTEQTIVAVQPRPADAILSFKERRASKLDRLFFGEPVMDELPDVTVTLQGLLPPGATAKAVWFSVAEDEQFGGQALFAYEITVFDASGAVFVPEDELTVTVASPLIAEALDEDKTVFVYRYTGREDETEKIDCQTDEDECRFKTGDLPARLVFTAEIPEDGQIDTGEPVTVAAISDGYIKASVIGPEYAETPVWSDAEGLVLSDGLELIAAYEVSCGGDGLRLNVELTDEPPLGELESLSLYSLAEGDLSEQIADDVSAGEEAAIDLDEADGFALIKDTGLRDRSLTLDPGDDGVVTISGRMPTEATAVAAAADPDAADEAVCAYDITLFNNGEEYQPGEANPLTVTIRSDTIAAAVEAGRRLTLWHISNDGQREEIADFELSDDGVTFTATSFSVYEIIEAPEPPAAGELRAVADQDEFNANYSAVDGFYLSYTPADGPMYFGGSLNNNGTLKEFNDYFSAAVWFFEQVPGQSGQYYIYTMVGGAKTYLNQVGTGNNVELSDTAVTAYVVTQAAADKFTIKVAGQNKWLQHSGSGKGIRLWGDTNNATNSRITLSYVSSLLADDDYYQLDGKTFGIAFHEESVKGAGLMAEPITVKGKQHLTAETLVVRPDVLDYSGDLLMAQDADITEWTFELVRSNYYYIKTQVGGEWKYLTLDGDDLRLLDQPDPVKSMIRVDSGVDYKAGMYHFSVGNRALTLPAGKIENHFASSADGGDYSWMRLVKRTQLLSNDDFVIYSAEKVDLSDREAVPDGSIVVVYTRIWNEEKKRYEFYAINSDGKLIRCYESGDMIQWVGAERVNPMLWDFTEYQYSDGTPNYYYELQNTYSGLYLAPQVSDSQVLFDHPVGINLNGRRFGYYYSTILAWDDDYYSYAGVTTEDGQVSSGSMDEAAVFYFAIMKDVTGGDDPQPHETLTEVETVDHTAYGITMKMVDLPTRKMMSDFLGSDTGGVGTKLDQGLLTTDLKDNGYPDTARATAQGTSLADLFSGATEVNHLFIKNIYYTSGYYEYDSTQNFATLYDENGEPSNDFTVYEQLCTARVTFSRPSVQHSQFLPYNKMSDEYSELNPENLYSATGATTSEELPDSDPRKYEKLRLVEGETDYYFGLEIEASFTQTPNGCDAWGHDIIYEFTGDDDFWLYVDGELVIDLGGIHSAVAGTVNFRTGDVYVNGTDTTLRDLFYNNYISRGHTVAEAEAYVNGDAYEDGLFTQNENGQWVFKDYTSHTMRIFYMERGAGASNLHMRFNLASVKPGTVRLSKELTGVDDTESVMAVFPYQIWYKLKDSDEEHLLIPSPGDGATVKYLDSSSDVPFHPSFTAADGSTYENVFLLRPDEIAEVTFPTTAIYYRVRECAVDSDQNTGVYDHVYLNDEELTGTANGKGRRDYTSGLLDINENPQAAFKNHVKAKQNLTLTKRLFDETGVNPIHEDNATFSFRLYLGTENDSLDSLPLANMYKYHVKDPDGNYCYWDAAAGSFVSLGKTDYADLTDEEKRAATFNTSMNGSISKIPVDYAVEVRDILAGSKYKVEERDYEIPDGYSLQKYVRWDETDASGAGAGASDEDASPIPGVIKAGSDPHVDVCNLKGWGLRVNKTWSDADFMEQRDPVYFAVFAETDGGLMLIDGTVRQLQQNDSTIYWYLPTLTVDGTRYDFDKFVVREVTLGNAEPTVAEDGTVTDYGNVTPVGVTAPDNSFTVSGKKYGDDSVTEMTYTAAYEQGVPAADTPNVRVDEMSNSRPGIEIYLTDWDGNPLAGGVFTLTDGNGNTAGAATYTADENGLVTIAYLRPDEYYTLTQIKAPVGFRGMPEAATVRVERVEDDYVVRVSGGVPEYYRVNDDGDTIIVRNKPFTLQMKKTQYTAAGSPLPGVHFALYRQVQAPNGQLNKDYRPIDGYDDLVTDASGLVPQVTEAFQSGELPPGVYYLYETYPVEGFRPLSSDVLFTLTDTGEIVIDDSSPAGVEVLTTADGDELLYTMAVPNQDFGTSELTVKKNVEFGTSADYGRLFNFEAKLYLPDGQTPWEYGDFVNGAYSFAVADGEQKTLTVPLGAVIKVTEYPGAAYTTTHQLEGEAAENGDVWQDTINEAETLIFNNSRKTVNVTVEKTVKGSGGAFNFTAQVQDGGVDCAGWTLIDANGPNSVDTVTDADGTATFTLSPGNNKTVSTVLTVPYGSTVTVSEEAAAFYTTTVKSGSGSAVQSNTVTIPAESTTDAWKVTFTNTQSNVSPTGLRNRTLPFLVLTLLGLTALTGALPARRKRGKAADKSNEQE